MKKIMKKTLRTFGYEMKKIKRLGFDTQLSPDAFMDTFGLIGINYGCGPNFMRNWVNIDLNSRKVKVDNLGMTDEYVYYRVDLRLRQPFEDQSFQYGFSEDFLEHLSQADSIVFLSECIRVLKRGGVLRMSFPGLEGVLKNHYQECDFRTAVKGRVEAFDKFSHIHFYGKENLKMVAEHLGFSGIQFVEYGYSDHEVLRNIDTREDQIYINTYVELVK